MPIAGGTFTITTALHEAHFDPMTAEARLVMPLPWTDLGPSGAGSLHASDGLLILARMRAEWGVVCPYDTDDDEADVWEHVGERPDGREVVALYGIPLLDTLTDEELDAAGAVLDVMAGLIPQQRAGGTA
jgi:hypothetical protein